MSGFWSWLAAHSRAVTAGSMVAALVVLGGGLVLGARQTSHPATTSAAAGQRQIVPEPVRVTGSRHSVVGVIRAIGPSEILVRNPRGILFAVRREPGTRLRADGNVIPPSGLHIGDRVVVIGAPTGDGALRASVVTVTSHAPAAPRTGTPGAPNPPRPAVPTRRPTVTPE